MKIAGNSFVGGEGTACSDPASSETIELTGAAFQTELMGVYTEVDITADNDYPERGGRPVFFGQGAYLYYYEKEAINKVRWYVGSSLGSTTIIMYVVSSALYPTAINAGGWKESNNGAWVSAPDVKVTCIRQC